METYYDVKVRIEVKNSEDKDILGLIVHVLEEIIDTNRVIWNSNYETALLQDSLITGECETCQRVNSEDKDSPNNLIPCFICERLNHPDCMNVQERRYESKFLCGTCASQNEESSTAP